MKINKDSLSMRAKNIANKKDVNVNVVNSRYFFDCFLKRLSISFVMQINLCLREDCFFHRCLVLIKDLR